MSKGAAGETEPPVPSLLNRQLVHHCDAIDESDIALRLSRPLYAERADLIEGRQPRSSG